MAVLAPTLLQVLALWGVVGGGEKRRGRWFRAIRLFALAWCAAFSLFLVLGAWKVYFEHGYVTAAEAADFLYITGLTFEDVMLTIVLVPLETVTFVALIRRKDSSRQPNKPLQPTSGAQVGVE